MLRSEYKQAKTKYELQKITICISNVLYDQYMDLFYTFFTFFLIFNNRNFDIGIFVLRSRISVHAIKKCLK